MTFKGLATQVLMSRIEHAINSDKAASALDKLSSSGKGFDLADIVATFQGSGGDVARIAKSWLGDGANESISASQVQDTIGSRRVAAFAQALGMDLDAASEKLARILPELVDKSSQGGYLIDSIGKKSFLAGFTSRFLKKSA
ncbi:MAG: YidB family protein [Gammaproteobacteria bacterium]|nr:YidB family protein [Gammaproteobacteria bacterium]MDH3480666.1 YidB family protein [Gammaproteobacteria bacterium]